MSQLDAIERRGAIVAAARNAGQVAVAELSEQFGVAPETIRRDLAELEQQGLVNRVHGGALPADRITFEGSVATRKARNPEEKAKVGLRAIAEIHDAESIYLDEGSTAAMIARALNPDRPLTVVTASIPVITSVYAHPNISVVLLGGKLRSRSLAVSGEWPSRMLRELVVDVAFMGTNGISLEHGFTCPDVDVAAVKRAAIAAARRTVVVTDASKIGLDTFASFAPLAGVDAVVTGAAAPRRVVDELRKRRVEVVLV